VAPTPPPQTRLALELYSYQQLARIWHRSVGTLRNWVSADRRAGFVVSGVYHLDAHHRRREFFIRGDSALAVHNRHVSVQLTRYQGPRRRPVSPLEETPHKSAEAARYELVTYAQMARACLVTAKTIRNWVWADRRQGIAIPFVAGGRRGVGVRATDAVGLFDQHIYLPWHPKSGAPVLLGRPSWSKSGPRVACR
jgi:hypothetical protein